MSTITVSLIVDGQPCSATRGQSLASLLLGLHRPARRAVAGGCRTPFCGMGVCGECRVTVDGRPSSLACMIPCREGMVVSTGGGE